MNENWKAKTNYFYYNSTVFLVFVYLSSCPEIRVNLEKRKINVVSREIQVNSNHFLSLKHKTDLGPMTYLGPMMSSGPRSLSNFPKRYLHIDIPHPFQTSFLVLFGTKKGIPFHRLGRRNVTSIFRRVITSNVWNELLEMM